jgi:hypothetical protein
LLDDIRQDRLVFHSILIITGNPEKGLARSKGRPLYYGPLAGYQLLSF